jgi:transposase InsO family protein
MQTRSKKSNSSTLHLLPSQFRQKQNIQEKVFIQIEQKETSIPVCPLSKIKMSSFIGTLPSYSDAQTSGDINLFFRQFERFIIANEITNEKRIVMLPMQLKGGAETYFNDLPIEVQDEYDVVKRELIRKFSPVENEFLNHQLLEARVQRAGETIDSYVESLLVLFKNVKETRETAKVIKFINGLQSKDLRLQLQLNACNYANLSVAVSAAKTYESIQNSQTINHKVAQSSDVEKLEKKLEAKMDKLDRVLNNIQIQTSKPSGRPQQPIRPINQDATSSFETQSNRSTNVAPTSNTTPAATAARPQRDLSNIQCVKCKNFGHFPKTCPLKVSNQCYLCTGIGHWASECTNPPAVKQEQKDGNVRAISKEVNSKFAIPAIVGDIKTKVIIDCGAGHHCMSAALYNRLESGIYPLRATNENLTNADGIKMDCKGIANVPIEYCNNVGHVEHLAFYIIEGLADPVLIGEDSIDEVKLANGMIVSKPVANTPTVVRMSKAVTVPAYCGVIIKGSVDASGLDNVCDASSIQILEPFERKNGIVARAVVEDDHVITNIINSSPNPIHLKMGDVIGELEPVTNLVDWQSAGQVNNGDEIVLRRVDDSRNDNDVSEEKEIAIRKQICGDDWITDTQKKQLVNCIKHNISIFAENPKAPAFVTNVKHRIDTGDSLPIKQRSYRTSRAEQEIIRKEISEMLQNKIIRPSESAWSSPIVLVTKKDGSVRFCVDFRKLNDVTKKDSYPLPRISETLEVLGKAKVFSSLDLASGYWQIPIDERDIEKTAFVSREGLFEFIRMPFGLTNAPGTFQRAVDVMLSGLNWKICLVYIDDILIFSESFEMHLADLQLVFDRLKQSGFSVKLSKCSFAKKEVTFLGHVVGANGVRPDEGKIKAIEKFPTPSTLTEVRSFLGSVNYYHKFVPGLATVAAPLFHLQKKNVHFRWSPECEDAFKQIKTLMVSSPTLRHPDFEREFYLHCDASDVGLGTVLSQTDNDGKEYVVAYGSKALSKEEKNYTVSEKECLAVLFAIKQYRPFIHGQKFTVVTDHGSLRWLFNVRDPNGRLQRWALKLQGLNMQIVHRAGKYHGNADALSRAPVRCINIFVPIRAVTRSKQTAQNTPIALEPDELLVIPTPKPKRSSKSKMTIKLVSEPELAPAATVAPAVEESKIKTVFDPVDVVVTKVCEQQNKDAELKKIIDYLRDNILPTDVFQANRIRILASKHVLTDGILYKMWQPTNTNQRMDVRKQLVVPSSLRQEIMDQMHSAFVGGGHYGFQRTIQRIRDRFVWGTMNADVELYCASCELCAARKTPHRTKQVALLSTPVPSFPFERIGIDFVGPFPESIAGNKYILVVTDAFSRWAEAWPTKDMNAETVAQLVMEEIVCRYGCPHYLLSDRGSNFLSALVAKMCELLQISKVNTTSYHPAANGITERANGILVDMLSIYSTDRDWDAYIPYVLSSYRSSYNSTIQETPYFMLFGNQMRLPVDVMVNNPVEYYTDRSDYVDEVHYRMHEAHKRGKAHLEAIRDSREVKNNDIERPKEFNVGDEVMLYMPQAPDGVSGKLYKPWRGPYKIAERLSLVNYRLIIPDSSSGRTPHDVVHVERLKTYVNPATTSAAVAARRQ